MADTNAFITFSSSFNLGIFTNNKKKIEVIMTFMIAAVCNFT